MVAAKMLVLAFALLGDNEQIVSVLALAALGNVAQIRMFLLVTYCHFSHLRLIDKDNI